MGASQVALVIKNPPANPVAEKVTSFGHRVVAHAFSYDVVLLACCCLCSVMPDSATPWTAAHQAPRSMGFPRQEHWSGLPFPSPMHESKK